MSETTTREKHELHLSGCERGQISGVREVLAFDPETIRLDTVCGRLLVKGHDLHISQLSVENGDITLSGVVNCVQYTGKGKTTPADSQSFWRRIFR